MSTAIADELSDLTRSWLAAMRARRPAAVGCVPPLHAALDLDERFTATREREGVRRLPGRLTVERVEAPQFDTPAEAGERAIVAVTAALEFPADEIAPGSRAADPAYRVPAFPATRVEVGAVTFDWTPGGWLLADWTVNGRLMSEEWCTHPTGSAGPDAAGLSAIARGLRCRDARTGVVYLEIHNDTQRDVAVVMGPPPAAERRSGLRLRRRPAAPDPSPRGLLVARGAQAFLAGRVFRPHGSEVFVTAYDTAGTLVTSVRLAVRLPSGHPGTHGEWCGYPPVATDE